MVKWETVAEFSFLFGVLLAVFMGTVSVGNDAMYNILMALGVIVGLVNIFDSQLERFLKALVYILICTISFYVLATLSGSSMLMMFKGLSTAVALFVAPIVFVLAIMDVYQIAMDYKEKKEKAAKAAAGVRKKR
ncbi:MAG: hypothetical protein N3G76_00930 [Candidatus Micrarchaeota archaeon]|nr:hypothetical protein [Candidatus Micrarchaeota archaeon]